jgi:release factor glutamine methyltransferase
MRNMFKVTPDTLVPRPETELLVESIVMAAEAVGGDVKILDIGTGSGAIIVSLLDYLPQAKGVGVDISVGALTIAKENAVAIGVAERAGFLRSDVYSALPLDKKFDIIVSNPPYIPAADIAGLAKDVQNEPIGALDGGEDGLDFYRRITKEAPLHMVEDGLLAFEIGIHQGEAVAEMCKAAGFSAVAIRKDYAGIERMVFAAKEGGKYADLLLEIAK